MTSLTLLGHDILLMIQGQFQTCKVPNDNPDITRSWLEAILLMIQGQFQTCKVPNDNPDITGSWYTINDTRLISDL